MQLIKFNDNKEHDKVPIFILLTNTGTVLSNAIQKFTKQPYNHVSLSMDIELKEMYSFGRKYESNPLVGTFVQERIDRGLFFNKRDTTTFSLYVTFVTKEEKNEIIQRLDSFRLSNKKFKYNFLGLFRTALGKTTEREDAYFCSEFVATILKDSINKHPSLVKPYDFAKNKNFFFISKGFLKNYDNNKNINRLDQLNKRFN